MGGGVLLLIVALSGGPRRGEANEAAPNLEPGQREVGFQFDNVHAPEYREIYRRGFPGQTVPLCDLLHRGFKNARVVVDEKRSVIIFRFDYNTSLWPSDGAPLDITHLLFRCADENGQILTTFDTKESFVADGIELQDWQRVAYGKLIIIKSKGNELIYPMNARDLHFVQQVEIGFKTTRAYRADSNPP
jgi:hypothetical protein